MLSPSRWHKEQKQHHKNANIYQNLRKAHRHLNSGQRRSGNLLRVHVYSWSLACKTIAQCLHISSLTQTLFPKEISCHTAGVRESWCFRLNRLVPVRLSCSSLRVESAPKLNIPVHFTISCFVVLNSQVDVSVLPSINSLVSFVLVEAKEWICCWIPGLQMHTEKRDTLAVWSTPSLNVLSWQNVAIETEGCF